MPRCRINFRQPRPTAWLPTDPKRCTKCGQVKPVSEFAPDSHRPAKPMTQCRECVKAYKRAWRERNREQERERNRVRASRYYQEHKAARRAYEARPEQQFRRMIRRAARVAVALGIIPRKDRCERCGASAKKALLHRHHPDYSRPLGVVWLCAQCHGWVHSEAGRNSARPLKRPGRREPSSHAVRTPRRAPY